MGLMKLPGKTGYISFPPAYKPGLSDGDILVRANLRLGHCEPDCPRSNA